MRVLGFGGGQISEAAGGYEVANSLRFNDGSSDYLNRTPASASNRRTFTISFWVKRGVLGTNASIFAQGSADNNQTRCRFIDSDSSLFFDDEAGGTSQARLITNRLFRDVSAWYHILIAVDTTQSTSSDRIKLYVNGVQETSFATSNYPSQNHEMFINTANAFYIGREVGGGYLDGYLAEFVFIDGQQLDPTSFGEFDADTGIWKPIDVSGLTFGTNGFYLDFENSGSLGADVSGNGNNFTVNNLTSIDQTTDTPTNNANTHNSLIKDLPTLSEGNLNVTSRVGSTWETATGAIGVSQGKWYCEYKVITKSTALMFGVISMTEVNAVANGKHIGDTGLNSLGYGYNHQGTKYNNGNYSSYGDTFTTEDIIGIAMDLDNHKLYFSKNGTWQNSGDPESGATGTGSAYDLSTGYDYTFGASVNNGSDEAGGNFGNPAFTISSGNSDGNGYGNFEYSVPSGYYALNTKNLAEFG